MAVTLISTAGDETANTYALLADATAYIANHYVPAATLVLWNAASNDVKSKALIQATMLLDRLVTWCGEVLSDSLQSLAWPRANAFDRYGRTIDSSVVPPIIQEYTIETALWLVTNSGAIPVTGSSQFDSIKVDGLEINYAKGEGESSLNYLPSNVVSTLQPMGNYTALVPNAARNVPLMRV